MFYYMENKEVKGKLCGDVLGIVGEFRIGPVDF